MHTIIVFQATTHPIIGKIIIHALIRYLSVMTGKSGQKLPAMIAMMEPINRNMIASQALP